MRADYCIVQREVPAVLQPYPAEYSNKTPVAPTAPSFEAWSFNKQKVEMNHPSIFPRLFILFMDLIFTRIGEQNMAFGWKIASTWVMFHLTWNLIQTKSVPQTTGQTCPPPSKHRRVLESMYKHTVIKLIWIGQNKHNLAEMAHCSAEVLSFEKALKEKFTAWKSQKNLPGRLMDLFTNQSDIGRSLNSLCSQQSCLEQPYISLRNRAVSVCM